MSLFRFKTDVSVSIIQAVCKCSDSRLTVTIPSLDLPEIAPSILGLSASYEVGDILTAICVSPVTFPASVLTWYINHNTADTTLTTNQTTVSLSTSLTYDLVIGELERASGRETPGISENQFSVVRLQLVVRGKLLRDNGG